MATREETKRMIEVMQAYVDGELIHCRENGGTEWSPTIQPRWNFVEMHYKIAKPNTRKVKLLAWWTGDVIVHRKEEIKFDPMHWKRVPSEDKEIEIEE